MNTSTVALSATVVLEEAAAVAVVAPVDIAVGRSVAARCSSVASSPADVSAYAEVTSERPYWSCSKRHLATATRSSRS
jgi:hypothetical protein